MQSLYQVYSVEKVELHKHSAKTEWLEGNYQKT